MLGCMLGRELLSGVHVVCTCWCLRCNNWFCPLPGCLYIRVQRPADACTIPKTTGGCFTFSREECCGKIDGRQGTKYYNQPCVPSASGDILFSTTGKCEPACLVLGKCGGKDESSVFGNCGVATRDPSVTQPPVYMHYMPWFTLGPQNTHWTGQLYEKDDLFLYDRYQQRGRVAAHYTPLIGPYSSTDRETIRLHLKLIRLAGAKGIILDWYVVDMSTHAILPLPTTIRSGSRCFHLAMHVAAGDVVAPILTLTLITDH